MNLKGFGLSCVLFAAVLGLLLSSASASDVPRITKEEVRPLLGNGDVILIDVRTGPDWDESPSKIVGAIREDPVQINKWMSKYPKEKTLIFYCA